LAAGERRAALSNGLFQLLSDPKNQLKKRLVPTHPRLMILQSGRFLFSRPCYIFENPSIHQRLCAIKRLLAGARLRTPKQRSSLVIAWLLMCGVLSARALEGRGGGYGRLCCGSGTHLCYIFSQRQPLHGQFQNLHIWRTWLTRTWSCPKFLPS
jgi:hypothetical protein